MRQHLIKSSLFIVLCSLAVPSWAANPTLPTAFTPVLASAAIRTPCPNSVGGQNVCNTVAEVTTALAAGACGDWILLNHLNTFSAAHWTPPSGLTCTNNNYLRITSDAYASLPAITKGQRAQASEKTSMPEVIIASNVNGAFDMTASGTAWIWIDFLNIHAPTTGNCSGGAAPTCGGIGFQVPFPPGTGSDIHHFVVDHSFVVGDSANGMVIGMRLSGANISATNNVVTYNWEPGGGESQSIAMNGTGPFNIVNNEMCAASETINSGDSSVVYWSGGSFGSGNPINPADITIKKNYIHKKCLPNGILTTQSKNLYEAKQGQRILLDSNIFDTAYAAAQQVCIQMISPRGSRSVNGDVTFQNNWVRNCPLGFGLGVQPAEQIAVTGAVSDGGTGCSGGPCIKLTLAGPCDCTTGDAIEVASVGGVTDANGSWIPITRVDSTHISLPKSWSGLQTYTSGGTTVFWFQGTPTQRIKISNNLLTNIAGPCCNISQTWPIFQWAVSGNIPVTGGTYNSISTTGNWNPDDWQIIHNTTVNPAAGYLVIPVIALLETGGLNTPYTHEMGARFIVRDNVFHNYAGSTYSIKYQNTAYGTAAMNNFSDSTTRTFSNNIIYEAAFADDATKYTGSDTWTTDSTTGCSVVVFVSCSVDGIAAAALQASSPGKNAASDGTDIGINATTLAIALDGVQTGIPSKAMVGGTGNVGGTLNIGQ